MEAAADLAGPADVEDQLLLVVLEARLVLLEALHVGEAVGVQVLEQRRERLLDLALARRLRESECRRGDGLRAAWRKPREGMDDSTPKIPACDPTIAGRQPRQSGRVAGRGARRATRCTRRSRSSSLGTRARAQYRARSSSTASATTICMRQRRGRGAGAPAREARSPRCFPSTTASAITTSYTGCTPLEHGLTGWFTYFGEAGCVSAPLPFRSRGDMLPLRERGVSPERAIHGAAALRALPVRAIVVTYRDIIDSRLQPCATAAAPSASRTTAGRASSPRSRRAVKSGDERKFVYAYWPHYDATSHRYGCESAAGRARARDASTPRSASCCARLVGHRNGGGRDRGPRLHRRARPKTRSSCRRRFAAMLRFPLCGERRVAYCHVHAAGRIRREGARTGSASAPK